MFKLHLSLFFTNKNFFALFSEDFPTTNLLTTSGEIKQFCAYIYIFKRSFFFYKRSPKSAQEILLKLKLKLFCKPQHNIWKSIYSPYSNLFDRFEDTSFYK